MRIIEADLTWRGAELESSIQIEVGPDGRITRVGALGERPDERLSGRALLPGFVNAHSHAFQIGLRGRTDRFPTGPGTFWSWRDAMYDLAASLDRERFHRLCVAAFEAMRDAGVTSVGEFHYLHHATERDYALDDAVLEAAAEVGIRIVLLQTVYVAGGIGTPLKGAQTRFETPIDAFWDRFDELEGRLGQNQSLGVAAHSIRAVPVEEIAALYEESQRRTLVFHMHVEEQRAEIEASLEAHGERPLSILTRGLGVGPGFVAVHATHATEDDLARLFESGGAVCVCPLTEAELGDGIPDLSPARDTPLALSLGSDANGRISLIEEARWLEYGQRLRQERRGVVLDARGRSGAALLGIATVGGARALGIEAGAIEPGNFADFVAVDLNAEGLAGAPPETIIESLIYCCGNNVVSGTYVSGKWRPTRRH